MDPPRTFGNREDPAQEQGTALAPPGGVGAWTPTPQQNSYRRRALLVGAALLILYLPLDAQYPDGLPLTSWRLAWIVIVALAALFQREKHPGLSLWALRIAIVVSGFGGIAVVAHTGGTQSARFGFLLAFPLVGLVLFPDVPFAIATLGATCLLGGVAITLGEGRGALFVVEWGMVSAALTLLAVVGALGFKRLWLSAAEARRDRAEALDRLALRERQHAEMERLAFMGRLAADVAHEISNPLCYVQSSVEFLHEAPAGTDQRQAFDDALHGLSRIRQIVADLRGMARGGGEQWEEFTAEAAMEEAWRLASFKLSPVAAAWSADPGIPRVRGSQRLLVQAMVNLLANGAEAASEATEPGRRWVRVRLSGQDGGVAIQVDDGGPGLRPEVAEHLFEPFFTTKGALGTGLGLCLVKEHVARCGGTVEGANLPGAGARFTIRLPAAAPSSTARVAPPSQPAATEGAISGALVSSVG